MVTNQLQINLNSVQTYWVALFGSGLGDSTAFIGILFNRPDSLSKLLCLIWTRLWAFAAGISVAFSVWKKKANIYIFSNYCQCLDEQTFYRVRHQHTSLICSIFKSLVGHLLIVPCDWKKKFDLCSEHTNVLPTLLKLLKSTEDPFILYCFTQAGLSLTLCCLVSLLMF